MASAVQATALKKFLDADLDLLVLDIRVVLVDVADYTYSAAHDFLADVAAGARVAVTGALAGKTTTGGLFDATDPAILAVTGDPVEALVVYNHTGSDATADLIAYIDTESDGTTPISFTPNGSDVEVQFPNGILSI